MKYNPVYLASAQSDINEAVTYIAKILPIRIYNFSHRLRGLDHILNEPELED